LATLCSGLVNRQLFKIEISKTPFSAERIAAVEQRIREEHQLAEQDLPYFIYSDRLTNKAYNEQKQNINLLLKNGSILDLSKASDNLNISALSTPVEKYFLCYPR
jgi:exoribonuclease II